MAPGPVAEAAAPPAAGAQPGVATPAPAAASSAPPASPSGEGSSFPAAAVAVPVAVGSTLVAAAAGWAALRHRRRREEERRAKAAAAGEQPFSHPFDTVEGQEAYASPFAAGALPVAPAGEGRSTPTAAAAAAVATPAAATGGRELRSSFESLTAGTSQHRSGSSSGSSYWARLARVKTKSMADVRSAIDLAAVGGGAAVGAAAAAEAGAGGLELAAAEAAGQAQQQRVSSEEERLSSEEWLGSYTRAAQLQVNPGQRRKDTSVEQSEGERFRVGLGCPPHAAAAQARATLQPFLASVPRRRGASWGQRSWGRWA